MRSNNADAGCPRCGFMRMSSGPSCLTENPRAGSSSCMDETPRSARRTSTPWISVSQSACGKPAKLLRRTVKTSAPNPKPRKRASVFGSSTGSASNPSRRPPRLYARQQFLRVSAKSQRAIHRDLTGLRRERLHNLLHHDGPMHPGRGLSRRQHFGHSLRVALWLVFLVFLLESARILPRIAHASLMRHRKGRRSSLVGHHQLKVATPGAQFKSIVGLFMEAMLQIRRHKVIDSSPCLIITA